MVSWFAGLFYIVRLMIYHTEADLKPESDKNVLQAQFKIMERRLWNIITIPAMLITLVSGLAMIYLNPLLMKQGWMHVKLTFVFGLLIYQLITWRYLNDLQNDIITKSSKFFRIWNEAATLFLVCISFIVVLKDPFNWIYGLVGIVLLGLIILVLLRLIKTIKK